MSDATHMRAALALARRGLGETAPNPSVGCVIVKEGLVVGRGRTGTGGRPHAEVSALATASTAARGATAYVTLEPCNHTGKTGPCTEALIEAGIERVVVGAVDPNPKVNGAGVARLRAAGIEVVTGVLARDCAAVISGFAMVMAQGRPLIRLKLASTLDGKIATASGASQWLTGESSRRAAHAMRGRHDAVMVGVGTVLADDPELTCRIEGFSAAPLVRIVVDSHLRTPLMSKLLRRRCGFCTATARTRRAARR
jgi:diaminohydroxyphosphoribosylaminopyrimidine deaminase/5-amino-6-(5-phosphoribosylamino)uracil reductase